MHRLVAITPAAIANAFRGGHIGCHRTCDEAGLAKQAVGDGELVLVEQRHFAPHALARDGFRSVRTTRDERGEEALGARGDDGFPPDVHR